MTVAGYDRGARSAYGRAQGTAVRQLKRAERVDLVCRDQSALPFWICGHCGGLTVQSALVAAAVDAQNGDAKGGGREWTRLLQHRGWLVGRAADATARKLGHLVRGDKQGNALRAVVAEAITAAVHEVVVPGDRTVVVDALRREDPDTPTIDIRNVLALREAVLRVVAPRLPFWRTRVIRPTPTASPMTSPDDRGWYPARCRSRRFSGAGRRLPAPRRARGSRQADCRRG